MLTKDPDKIKAIWMSQLEGLSDEDIRKQAKMFNVPIAASAKIKTPVPAKKK